MEWYVFRHNFNKRTIEKWNIFDHGSFAEDVEKLLKEDVTKEEFEEKLKRHVMYYYVYKCEWETIITSWPCYINKEELDRLNFEYEDYNKKYGHYPYRLNVAPDVGNKVDVADQVFLNWDHFVNYVWDYKNN